ncbi:MAG: DNA primase [Candidatus Omnitrophica bacterium]|nr:DNA primase [Candidatus Omnitrophota bacterium]MCM8827881.1 DNA primase [Candidatus Omnitrophota bacterium]
MLTAEKIDEIIEKLDIVEVVSRYVHLKKSGRSHRGLCPFHPEKTPSFFVSSEKQIFHCFGCGVGGNIITFLMKMENIDFAEAARMAAEMAGVRIYPDTINDEKQAIKKTIFEANKIAQEFFSLFLESSSGDIAVDFLEKRGISQIQRKKFGLGYAPSGGRLVAFLMDKKLKISDFEQAKLIVKKDDVYTDVFKHRVTIPIFDHQNNIAGFGARALEEQQQPKYLNTPESYVFKKGSLFYGLNWAKEKIKNSGFAIIVEGYFDLIKMHMAGFENTIAPLGTSLTENHLRLLKRWTSRVLLVFDSDSAGTAAAFRSLETIIAGGFEVKIGVLPAGFDPEDFIDNYGADALKKLLNQSRDFVDFAFYIESQKYSIEDPKGRAKLVEEILKLIKNIPDEIERSLRIKQLAKMTGIEGDILLQQMSRISEKTKIQNVAKPLTGEIQRNAVDNAEKTLIKILLRQPELAKEISGCMDLLPDSVRSVMDCCLNEQVSEAHISKFLNKLNDPEQVSILTQAILKETADSKPELIRKEFYDCVGILCRKSFEKRVKELKETIKQKIENNQNYEKELEEMNLCIKLTSQKSLDPFLSRTERSNDGEK